MSQPSGQGSLAARLRSLRTQAKVTQAQVAAALGVSTASVSAWESGNQTPPVDRLRDYALAFAVESVFTAEVPALPEEEALSEAEDRRRQRLVDELVTLRDRVSRSDGGQAEKDLPHRFWQFDDDLPIRIVTTPMWRDQVQQMPYADPLHPNYLHFLHDADRDATTELYGHLKAENPRADIAFKTADQATNEDLTGHVVILGQGDQLYGRPRPGPLAYLAARLEIPFVMRLPEGGDPEFDSEYAITLDDEGRPSYFSRGEVPPRRRSYRPRFLRTPDGSRRQLGPSGFPLLEYDVAALVRKPNELNRAASVTVVQGAFSQGTYGAVRALTDVKLRDRNEDYLAQRFDDRSNFWMLFFVPVYPSTNGIGAVTPDLSRPFHRLADSVDATPPPAADTVDAAGPDAGEVR